MIPERFIEELKYKTDIAEIISSYVEIKRKGRTFSGLCPFHSEKTPSFVVYPDSQSFYCFGCGAGGDVISFVRRQENLEYIEALRLLAEKAGMQLPEDAQDDGAARLKGRIWEMNREAARFFHSRLMDASGSEARSYLLGRGLTPKTIRHFGLGYAPEGWDSLRNHLRQKGFSKEEMLEASLVLKSQKDSLYDAFRQRVMFPIIDLRGNVIGFGGRNMGDRGPKYLNSSDTPVFKKSRNLYALNFAKEAKADTLILAEGYMDVIAIHQAGFVNTVATLGTSLTAEQARLISQYAKNVLIAYDSDGAGQSATKRAIQLFSQTDVTVRVLEISGAKDPDEYIKKFGAARFGALIEGGKGAVQFEIDKLKARFNLDNPEEKVAFLNEFCGLMAGVPGEVERDVYLSGIARELEVEKAGLAASTNAMRKKRYQAEQRKKNSLPLGRGTSPQKSRHAHGESLGGVVAQENLIAMILQNPDYYGDIRSKIAVEDFSGPDLRQIYLTISSRLEQNLPADPIYLSSALSLAQMDVLSRLIAQSKGIPFYKKQADEFIAAIRLQKSQVPKEQLAQMSPDEIQKYILKNKKK